MNKEIQSALMHLRKTKPLVLCLTNYVTMDFMANTLLALGAAPIMSQHDSELEELISISHAININIGTLDEFFIKRAQHAVKISKKYQKPIILDPVGAGASKIRTNTARELSQYSNIIRGNASEIMALTKDHIKTSGVESTKSSENAAESAYKLAKLSNATIIVSGAEDIVTDGIKQKNLTFGDPMMQLITGMGCTLTAVVAAFKGIMEDSFEAAALATEYFGYCGQQTALETKTPGAFRTVFIDKIYSI